MHITNILPSTCFCRRYGLFMLLHRQTACMALQELIHLFWDAAKASIVLGRVIVLKK